MKIKNSKLQDDNGSSVEFVKARHTGGKLADGKPKFLVIHYTAGGSGAGTVNFFKSSDVAVSAHLIIDRDGKITQMVDFDTTAFHAGKSRWKGVKGLNSHSVGIEIANWGKLRQTAAGGWISDTNSAVAADRVIVAEHRNSPGAKHGWEVFDAPQFDATVAAAKAIVREFELEPWDVVGHDDISPLRKIDPGPAFPMDSFRAKVFGRAEDDWDDILFKVNSANGLNMRIEPLVGASLIKNLSEGTVVHVIEKSGLWWLVSEVIDGKDDVTGFVHSHFLDPM